MVCRTFLPVDIYKKRMYYETFRPWYANTNNACKQNTSRYFFEARKYSISCCVICIVLAFSGRGSLKFFNCKICCTEKLHFQFLFYQNCDNIVCAKLFCKQNFSVFSVFMVLVSAYHRRMLYSPAICQTQHYVNN